MYTHVTVLNYLDIMVEIFSEDKNIVQCLMLMFTVNCLRSEFYMNLILVKINAQLLGVIRFHIKML